MSEIDPFQQMAQSRQRAEERERHENTAKSISYLTTAVEALIVKVTSLEMALTKKNRKDE